MLPEVAAAVTAELSRTGNASSLHASGRRARRAVEESRESIGAVLGVDPGDVVFTAGGTEADNLAVKGLYGARHGHNPNRTRVLASAVEHHAVLDSVQALADHDGADISWLGVDRSGRVELDELRSELAAHADEVSLVTVMWANNEVGTLQPVAAVAELCAEHGVPLHTDAVQAVGVAPVDPSIVTTLALSGHKLGGPMGVGALVVRRGTELVPLLHGGGQELDIRSGTLNTPAVVGLATALTSAAGDLVERVARVRALRDDLVRRVRWAVPDAVLNGDPVDRLPGNAHFSFPGCEGDALLLLLDAQGVECSTGSACSAGVPQSSHVLLAMGLDEVSARGSLRFSLGHTTTEADIDALIEVLPGVVERARRAGGLRTPDVAV
jgi:cysteine desulfurase